MQIRISSVLKRPETCWVLEQVLPCVSVQVGCSRTVCVWSCGSATAWTRWATCGRPAAGTGWTATTAAAPTAGCSAPITAACLPARGARGPAGQPAALPVGGAWEPDTGEVVDTLNWVGILPYVPENHFSLLLNSVVSVGVKKDSSFRGSLAE